MKKIYLLVVLLIAAFITSACSDESEQAAEKSPLASAEFKQLEKDYGARLGVYAIDTGTKETVAYREDERFAYASLVKALASAVLLKQNPLSILEETRTFTEDDVVPYSPVTENWVNKEMGLGQIIEAAMQQSDNTAGNLLFAEVGGSKGLEQALRESGDETTIVERKEPQLNEAVPGDKRDTSTPRALAADLELFGTSEYLSEEKQNLFTNWLKESTTGDSLIRAGLPEDWIVGDKSGAGSYGTRNDLAIAWPPNR